MLYEVITPSGIGHDYGKSWSGRYLSESSDLAFVAASGVLAYKFSDRLSLAAGPYMVYTDSTTKARVNNLSSVITSYSIHYTKLYDVERS